MGRGRGSAIISRARILITDGETRATLAAVRGLHDAGFEVAVAAPASARPAPSHWSRCTAERVLVPHPLDDERGFLESLESRLASQRYRLLIAGSDASLLAISAGRDKLSSRAATGLPPHEVVERALDKRWLTAAATRTGLTPPETVACADAEKATTAAHRLGFPVVVKPQRSIVDRGAFRAQVGSVWVNDGRGLAAAIRACGGRVLVQRIEAGAVLSFAGVRAGGEMLGEAVSRYKRTWYPDAGNVSFSETVAAPGELRVMVTRLLEELGWEGLFELELIARRDGGWAAIDFNPRLYGSLALAIAAGVNLPALWCRHLLGEHTEVGRARPGLRYRWEDADLRHAYWQLRHGRPARAASALRVHRHVVHPYFRVHDPAPFAARLVFLAKAVQRRLRPEREDRVDQDVRDPSAPGPVTGVHTRAARAPVVVIGGGPYGLSVAAHLRAAGLPVLAFGEPLGFWRHNMPAGMLLRSPRRATHIAASNRELSIDRYEIDGGGPVRRPTLRLQEFVDYATWFQRRAVPDLDRREIVGVVRGNGRFRVTLDDREELDASRVVVAAGLAPFARWPEPFRSLPRALVSHSSEHADLAILSGKRVAVIGAGQSALESAALLNECGATVEVLVRERQVNWLPDDTQLPSANTPRIGLRAPPTGVGGRLTGWVAAAPDAFRHVPERLKPWVSYRCIRPAGSGWLRPRLEQVPITCGRFVARAEPSGEQLRLTLDDGSDRVVNHVLLGTGYDIDVTRYSFLRQIAAEIQTAAGYPLLGPGLESSIPGLHFVGAPAALSFGPIMRFVVGSWYAAPAVTLRILGRRPPPLRLAIDRIG